MRFSFGRNWKNYSSLIDEARLGVAMEALSSRLGDLQGKSFLDIGCGSGLHSLAAFRLGASRIFAFDFDRDAVECTKRVVGDHPNFHVERGDVLDAAYVESLGKFDVVYCWGVLHHTGSMWQAIGNAVQCVAPGGLFEIAIYNDQGRRSEMWRKIKWTYNAIPVLRWPMIAGFIVAALMKGRGRFVRQWKEYRQNRGMSQWYDIVDWLGGYPFEVASREAVTSFLRERGFEVTVTMSSGNGSGCNEYVASALATRNMVAR